MMKNQIDPRKTYRENAVRGASPLELVVILYETAVADMQRGLAAMERGDIEERGREIGHALLVLGQLQATLDFAQGGEAAKNFEQFYSLVRAKILESQLKNAPELLQRQIEFLCEVRDCWSQVAMQLKPTTTAAASSPALLRTVAPEEGVPAAEWNA